MLRSRGAAIAQVMEAAPETVHTTFQETKTTHVRIKDAQNELKYNYWIFLKAEVNLLILPQITVQVADTQTQGEKRKRASFRNKRNFAS